MTLFHRICSVKERVFVVKGIYCYIFFLTFSYIYIHIYNEFGTGMLSVSFYSYNTSIWVLSLVTEKVPCIYWNIKHTHFVNLWFLSVNLNNVLKIYSLQNIYIYRAWIYILKCAFRKIEYLLSRKKRVKAIFHNQSSSCVWYFVRVHGVK